MTIRTLPRDEPVPTHRPRRYTTGAGYVRLRWRVGPDDYVEEYEHRVVMGRPDGHVHHLNGRKKDNRPENLAVLSATDHHAAHHAADVAAGRYRGRARDRTRAARKAERAAWWAQVAAEHAAGASTVELGRRYGRHPSNISRGLHARGYPVAARPGG